MAPAKELQHLPHAHGVYRILNVRNGKAYVGSAASQTIRRRCGVHRCKLAGGYHTNRHLQSAWNLSGPAAFRFEVLEECEPEACLAREQFWIDKFAAADRLKGYNLSPTARSARGVKHTTETRKKISAAVRRRWADPEFRTRTAATIAESLRDPAVRKRRSQAARAAFAGQELRDRQAEQMRKTWKDEDYRSRVLAARRQAHATPEVKAKMAARATPEVRAKISAAGRGCVASAVTRARMAESQRKAWERRKATAAQQV